MIEAVGGEDIVDGELLNWGNLNLYDFEEDYSYEKEWTVILNSVTSSNNKRDPFRLNPFYIYLDTCSALKQNINKNTIQDIQRIMRGIESRINGGVGITNQKGNCVGFLGYLETWFQPNGLCNILSFLKV